MAFDPNQPYEIESQSAPVVASTQTPAPSEPIQPTKLVDRTVVPAWPYRAMNAVANVSTGQPMVELGLKGLKFAASNMPSPLNYLMSDEQKAENQRRIASVPTELPDFKPFRERSYNFRDLLEGRLANSAYQNIIEPVVSNVRDAAQGGYNFVRNLHPERVLPYPSSGLPQVTLPEMPNTIRDALGEPFPTSIKQVTSDRQYDKLPVGSWYTDSTGKTKRKMRERKK